MEDCTCSGAGHSMIKFTLNFVYNNEQEKSITERVMIGQLQSIDQEHKGNR